MQPFDSQKDFESLTLDTYNKSGIRGKMLGFNKWTKLMSIVLHEAPTWYEEFPKWDRKYSTNHWSKRVQVAYKAKYGFDPLTWFLIFLVIKIAILLFIWWLNNRKLPVQRVFGMRRYLLSIR